MIPFKTCFAMFLGSFGFWLAERLWRPPESQPHRILVQNQETICAGLIAGGALMGIAVTILEVFVLAR